jgi:hypothetical protein
LSVPNQSLIYLAITEYYASFSQCSVVYNKIFLSNSILPHYAFNVRSVAIFLTFAKVECSTEEGGHSNIESYN